MKGEPLILRKSLHFETMKQLNIFDDVKYAFATIGLSHLLALNCPAYYE